MHHFDDEHGSRWNLEINIGNARSFRSQLDLIDGQPQDIAQEMLTNVSLRLDMLWHFLTEKAQVADRESFESLLTSNVLTQADKALWDELVFFTRHLRPESAEVIPIIQETFKKFLKEQTETVGELARSNKLMEMVEEKMASMRAEATLN